MPLFWRILWLNALVGGAATVLLMVGPWTVSAPVRLIEAVVLVAGLAVMLAANALLLRVGLAPLERLTRRMTSIDLLRPGQRLPVTGSGEVAVLIRTFNEMIGRLEAERGASSARALSAQEGERQRIARELHDEIGQSLTAVLLEINRAADLAPEPLRTDLRHAQETTRDSLDEVRRVARRLRPGVLKDLGLVSALMELTTHFSTHTGLTMRRHIMTDLVSLNPQIELVLYPGTTRCSRHRRQGRPAKRSGSPGRSRPPARARLLADRGLRSFALTATAAWSPDHARSRWARRRRRGWRDRREEIRLEASHE